MSEISTEELRSKGTVVVTGAPLTIGADGAPAASALDTSAPVDTSLLRQQGQLIAGGASAVAPPPANAAPDGIVSQLGRQTGRQLGLTARYGAQGITDLPLMINDAFLNLYNMAAPKNAQVMPASQVRDQMLNSFLPQPKGGLEETIGQGTRAVASTFTGTGVGNVIANNVINPVTKAVATNFAAAPGVQSVAGATGSMVPEAARQAFDIQNPLALLGLGIGGALVGGGAAQRFQNVNTSFKVPGTNITVPNINPNAGSAYANPDVGNIIQQGRKLGVDLSAAEVAPNSVGGRAVAGARNIAGTNDARAANLTDQVTNMIENATENARTPEVVTKGADRAVATDLRTQYTANKKTASKLYDAVDTELKAVPGSERIKLGETVNTVQKLIDDFPEWTAITGASKTVRKQIETLGEDASGTTNYTAMRKVVQEVGQLVGATNGVQGKEGINGQLKNLYAALMKDVDNWAATNKNPKASEAYGKAKSFFTENVQPYRENPTINGVVSSKVKGQDYDRASEKLTQSILSTGNETTQLATNLMSPQGNAAFRFKILEDARLKGINPDASTPFSAAGYQRGVNLGRSDTPTGQRTVLGTDAEALANAEIRQQIIDSARGVGGVSKGPIKTGFSLMPKANMATQAGAGYFLAPLLGLDPVVGGLIGTGVAPKIANSIEGLLGSRTGTDFLLGQGYRPGQGLLTPEETRKKK
jgi:hypothetical protein